MVGQGGEARLTTGLWGEVGRGVDYREVGGNSEEGQLAFRASCLSLFFTRTQVGLKPRDPPGLSCGPGMQALVASGART